MDEGEFRVELAGAVPALHRYALLLTGNEQDAADLVQDTVVRGLEAAGSFEGRSALTTWLRRIMHHRWVDVHRARHEVPSDDIGDLVEAQWRDDSYTVDASVVIERAQTRDDLREALAHLPAIYRTAVVLHDAEGMTVAEIAQLCRTAVPAMKQRLRRGRMMLVTALAADPAAHRSSVPMRCWQARSQVSEYMDGSLAAGPARMLETHLTGCTTCPPLYASLVAARDALVHDPEDRDPDTVVPPELAARIADFLSAR